MSVVYVPGATRVQVMAELTRNWVDTADATRHICLRRCTSGSILWTLWECTDANGLKHRYIGCDQLVSGTHGWGYRAMIEADNLRYVSCPLAYLREAPTVSPSWRKEVAAYWARPMRALGRTHRQVALRPAALRFKEGDRVRYLGPTLEALPRGSTGTVALVAGASRATVHADELCNTTFVRWDCTAACAVFTTHLAGELPIPAVQEDQAV